MILLCTALAALLIAGVTTASAAFLAQRDLEALCDGAAVAAASGAGSTLLYGDAPPGDPGLPLDEAAAAAAAQAYVERAGRGGPSVQIVVSVADGSGGPAGVDRAGLVTVGCAATVGVPFGAAFGLADGLPRRTISSARAPLRS